MENNKKRIKVIVLAIILSIFVVIGITFAWFKFSDISDNTNTLTTAELELRLDEYDEKVINLVNTYPLTDETGSKTKAYEFSIVNNSNTNYSYEVKLVEDSESILEDGCKNDLLPDSILRYQLEREDSLVSIDTLSNKNDWIIDTYRIGAKAENHYKLRIWVAESAGNEYQSKHFHAKIEVRAIAN